MDQNNMTSDWHYAKTGAPGGGSAGPLSWEQLYSLAQTGGLTPADLVWHPQLPQWLPAGQIQGLFPAGAPAGPWSPTATQPGAQWPGATQPGAQWQAPPPAGAYQPYPGQPSAYAAVKKRSPLVWVIPVVVLVLAGLGLGLGLGLTRGDGKNDPIAGGGTTTTARTTTTDAEATTTTATAETTTTVTVPGPAAWTDLSPAGGLPAVRDGHGLVYDATSKRLLLFGGYSADSYLNDTWSYDTGTNTWTELSPGGTLPPARNGFSMVYDEARNQVIVFGGWSEDLQLDDTWAYDPLANTWTELAPVGDLPPARAYASAVYDPSTDKVILFGGWDDFAASELNDTWAYDPVANTWTELSPGGEVPGPRDGQKMVADRQTGKVILFGGFGAEDPFNDTWEYDPIANTWSWLDPSGDLPSPRAAHSMVYDPTTQRVIVFGGYDGDFSLGDTWAYDPAAGAWSEAATGPDAPSARNNHAAVYYPGTGSVILFGGYDDEADLADTWSFGT